MALFHLQDLEKSKPVVLTGDLNCAHEEIDIFNPAVTNSSSSLPCFSIESNLSGFIILHHIL